MDKILEIITENPELFLNILTTIFALIGTALSPKIIKVIMAALNKFESKLKIDIDDAKEQQMLETAMGVVGRLYHTTVRELKKDSDDGKLTSEEAKDAFMTAAMQTKAELAVKFKEDFSAEKVQSLVAEAIAIIKQAKNGTTSSE